MKRSGVWVLAVAVFVSACSSEISETALTDTTAPVAPTTTEATPTTTRPPTTTVVSVTTTAAPTTSVSPTTTAAPTTTAVPPTTTTSTVPQPDWPAIVEIVVDEWRSKGVPIIPGVSVAVLLPDGTEVVVARGVADLVTEVPVTPDDYFRIGSISKTITSVALLQ